VDPSQFVGRAPQQVDEFLAEVVEPIRQRYSATAGPAAEVKV
jgi:adenylosuccinate lyase